MTPRHPSVPNLIWDKGDLDVDLVDAVNALSIPTREGPRVRMIFRTRSSYSVIVENEDDYESMVNVDSRVAARCSLAGKQTVVSDHRMIAEHNAS